MDGASIKLFIEAIAGLMLPIVFFVIMWDRSKQQRGTGARTIQLLTVAQLFPLLVILGFEKIIEPSAIATLLGALVGYVLSGVGNYQPKTSKDVTSDTRK